ncbi:DUF6292 family protein [Amycolatopsis sp. NBRC 101858]|uniref:DUF6292 family protein n=1 Tax=Amycolatopsis sp. NBRC 101858 TaxID=3032200 RepID=UPI0025547824|nr:DUF6292 family protein [Amycolatopsis sp. NBRC 101858]
MAAELRLPVEDTAADAGEPMCGQIRFAGRTADRPARDRLLTWEAHGGWQLAGADRASGAMRVIAVLAGPARPAPRAVADFAVQALAARGERLVRRQTDGDRLALLLDRHSIDLTRTRAARSSSPPSRSR